jgi:1-aminocyclopropane-1-carboxylate deaminase/D-cysteine desulfhydrase-like pyridoxal-dependent ACC family enzyme
VAVIRALSLAASVEALAGALPRTPLAVLPTPLVAAPRLASALGTGPLLVKRDDLTGFAFGGNKARLLEFLVTVVDARGPGHGLPSPDGLVAAEQAMRTEGLMLDPVYTAKALAQAATSGSVVFWHTGGVLDAVAAAQEASS